MATDAPMATATDTAADTATETQILTLTQWLSPGFPVGAYAYSHGLEWLVETGDVRDVPSLSAWLRDVIEVGAGRADILFLAAAYRAPTPDALLDTDALARAFAAKPDLLLMDEPFVSLDRELADEMMALFEKLRDAHQVTTLLVTHVAEEAERLATRVITLGGKPARITSDAPVPDHNPAVPRP